MKDRAIHSIIESFYNLPKANRTLSNLVNSLGDKSFGILFVFLALPSSLPIPTGGIAHAFGIILLIIIPQYIWGRETVWLPSFIANKRIAQKDNSRFVAGAIRFSHKLNAFIKPRSPELVQRPSIRFVIGPMLLICALGMLTYIPFMDTIPALGLLIIGLGLIERDAYALVAGSLIGMIGSTLAIVLSWGGLLSIVRLII